jgi:hypothetical protein
MQRETKLLVAFEMITFLLIFIVSVAVLYPIKSVTHFYPYFATNIVFIALSILGVRYLFGLKYSFLAKRQEAKIVVMLLMVPLAFSLIGSLREFMEYVESLTFDPITGHLPDAQRFSTNTFIWREMLIFGIGSILSACLLPVSLLSSIWRQRNSSMTKRKSIFHDTDEY